MADPNPAAQLSLLTGRLMETAERALEGLSIEQLNDTHGDTINSIGFDIWHVTRTTDNAIHFVFEREEPVWLRMGLHEAWDLPKVAQGTGMDEAEAYTLRFPEPAEFARYVTAVGEAVVPRIAAMDQDYLATITKIMPWGEIPRMEIIGQVLVAHGNGHLGRVDAARTRLGLEGLGY